MKDYKDLNDYEIIYMVGENDDTAKLLMYQKYSPLIKKYAQELAKYTNGIGIDKEDLEQEGLAALASSMKRYDSDSSALFYTYAVKAIKRKMHNLIRVSLAKKNYILNNSISLDASLDDDGTNLLYYLEDKKSLVPDIVYESNDFFQRLKDFLYELSIEEASVLELRLNNFRISEISKLLDISCNGVRIRLDKIRKKINFLIEK